MPPPDGFVRNYFTELPNDLVNIIHQINTGRVHSELMQDLSHNISHILPTCNPEMSFIQFRHLRKNVRYFYYKLSATLIIHEHSFGTLMPVFPTKIMYHYTP